MIGDTYTRDGIPERPIDPPAEPHQRVCRCGHEKDMHEHYRRGSDCAECGCLKFRRDWWA